MHAEFQELLECFTGERDEDGRSAVVRNGFQPEREIHTGLGLVVIGVSEHGQKKFHAVGDGVRESRQSWRELLLALNATRPCDPGRSSQWAIGALGFWATLAEIYSETHPWHCRNHKTVK